jgi:hypothetical protein
VEKCPAEMPEVFAAGSFENVEKSSVIDVVAGGAVGVGDPAGVLENHAPRLKAKG